MKILTNNKFGNICLILSLALCVVLMLSSFILRLSNPPVDNTLDESIEPTNETEEIIQVNVLNACGKNGLASEVQQFLIERGYDVVSIGNYDSNLENSVIIDRLGDINSTNKVAYALGMQETQVRSEIDSSQLVRSTIIIGKDYFTLKPFSSSNNLTTNY